MNGTEYPYTTFRNTRYWIRFLPPQSVSDLPEGACYDDYRAVADRLDQMADGLEREYKQMLAGEADSRGDAPRPKRRGGGRIRIEL